MLSPEGTELKKIQLGLGMKAKDFAERLDIQPSYLSAIMHGSRNLTLNLLSRIEDCFDLDREAIFRLRNAKRF